MDITIQMRSLELLIKMLKRDMEGIPAYGYTRQMGSLPLLSARESLPRCTPEEAGLSSTVVERFFRNLSDNTAELGIHSAMLLRHGKVFAEGYYAPYRPEIPHMLYSASKSVTSTAIGMAVDEGLMDIDERLEGIFPGYAGKPANKWSKMLTVRHLLTMSTGVRFNEVGSALDEDWVKMFMESVPKFEPGTQFEYNSLNTYMLSAVLRKKTGMSLTEFLTPRLYEPLDIRSHHWETCPKGMEKGGWGLNLCIEDLAKIAQLYLNKGVWNGRRLLSEEWIDAATSPQIPTPNGEMRHGYGYQIWMSGGGAYQFNGAFGQYAVIFPQYDAVAVIYSGSTQLFAKTSLMQLLDSCFWACSDRELAPYPPGYDSLKAYLAKLVFSPEPERKGLGTDKIAFNKIRSLLDGREFRLFDNYGSLFPQPLQNVHGCYSKGADIIRFSSTEKGLAVTFYEQCERNTVYIDMDGGFTDSVFIMKEEQHLVSTRGIWSAGENEACITLFTSFLETPDTRIIELRILNESIEAVFDETPTAEGATKMLLELVGLVDDNSMKRLLPAMKHVPGMSESTITDIVKKYAAPRSFGREIHLHQCIL